jgi:hypothetical protein
MGANDAKRVEIYCFFPRIVDWIAPRVQRYFRAFDLVMVGKRNAVTEYCFPCIAIKLNRIDGTVENCYFRGVGILIAGTQVMR